METVFIRIKILKIEPSARHRVRQMGQDLGTTRREKDIYFAPIGVPN